MRKGKLGKIFVKYNEPIDLNEYMAKNEGMKGVALKLTRELYQIQQTE